MIVVVVVCVAVIVALVVANLRLRRRTDELVDLVQRTASERDTALAEVSSTSARAETLTTERDEALERVNRARRDAADVANRLQAEAAVRADVEDQLRSALDDLAVARAAGPGGVADVLWALSLRQTEQTWRLSVAVDPLGPSPIDDADDPLRAAVEIEVDAAREESGAPVDLEWTGETSPSPERAVVALALVRDVIAELGTTAAELTVAVDSTTDAIEIVVSAVDDDGAPLRPSIPAALEAAPGHARIT